VTFEKGSTVPEQEYNEQGYHESLGTAIGAYEFDYDIKDGVPTPEEVADLQMALLVQAAETTARSTKFMAIVVGVLVALLCVIIVWGGIEISHFMNVMESPIG
jgi:hypothetical protein